ncbi:serine/threonine-protein kinase [Streptomyces sp. NPDC102360]|uniref:serine/threonine-protein kinase n=1 Tax=Streptomyces sp. NPDC102360 TaxID=3366160 RepID=UPI0038158781
MASRYRLDASIGQGGMGRVWRAVDEMLDRRVAVKEMRIDGLDPEDARTRRERTLREARATARIDHPGVVRVYDVVDEGERLWIVMELVDGRSLEQLLVEDGPLPADEVARIGLSLAGALRQVHAGGVLHRDIKPGNVLIEGVGQHRVMLTDFGIAAIQDTKALTMAGMLVGSPDYMAPERVSGHPQGPPSDFWSLGATLCAALGGGSPFSRETTLATLHAVLYEEPQLPYGAGDLAPLLTALLAKEPGDRPDLDRVTRSLTRTQVPAPPPPASPPPPPPVPAAAEPPQDRSPDPAPTRRSRALFLIIGGAGTVGLTAVLALLLPNIDPPDGRPTSTTSRPPTVEGTSRAPTESLPAGARREAGYAWVPPKGWERVVKTASEVHYTSPDGNQELVAQSALAKDDLLATWQKSERAAHQGQDYRKLRLTRTTFRGRPAVVWEYLFTLKGARWHAELLGFDRGTRSYQLGTWYRPESEPQARKTYEKVKSTFTPSGTSSPAGD